MMRVLIVAFAVAFAHATDAPDTSSCSAAGSCKEDANAAVSEDTNFMQLASAKKNVKAHARQSAMIAECGSLPAFSSATCPEGKVCTYTESTDGLTFTFERAEGVVKIAFESGATLYMADGSLMLSSPCHPGEVVKTGVFDTESHTVTCSDKTVRDVGPDGKMVQLTATANGIDVFEADMKGDSPLSEHVEFESSIPRHGAIVVPSDFNQVSQEEFAHRLAQLIQGCPSLVESQSLSKSLDGAVSKKSLNPMQWLGVITMAAGGLMMAATFAGCAGCMAGGIQIMSSGLGYYYAR